MNGNKWHNSLRAMVAIVLALGVLLGPAAAPTADAIARAHPALALMAAEAPDQTVAVIVQEAAGTDAPERLVADLGGEITKDLRIINAFAAELTAQAALKLAAHPDVRWVSLDAGLVETGKPCAECVDTSQLLSAYVQTVGADRLWNEAPYLQGQGVAVAVVDSGITQHNDLGKNGNSRVVAHVKFNSDTKGANDGYGHGTHVAGIIGGDGYESRDAYIGIAPRVNLVNVKVSDDRGAGSTSDMVAGLQWILENKDAYNIRVVNISVNSSVAESYHTSALNAAVEILWFNGLVVVVSAGNNGAGEDNGILFPPANDPFVITVGATDDQGTVDLGDDTLAAFSAYGTTADGFAKPDLVAPGTNIVSLMASQGAEIVKGHPEHRVDGFPGSAEYFRISGTSMSSPMVAGVAALLLQDEPNLTPDQVKYRLMATARPFGPGAGAGYVDAYAAVHGTTTESANTGLAASQLLWTGDEPIMWNSVMWNSVMWNSVMWNSVMWNSVAWDQ